LAITTETGVRSIVRALDVAGVELPSIRAVVDDVIAWPRAITARRKAPTLGLDIDDIRESQNFVSEMAAI
jgi:hypothetical protein